MNIRKQTRVFVNQCSSTPVLVPITLTQLICPQIK